MNIRVKKRLRAIWANRYVAVKATQMSKKTILISCLLIFVIIATSCNNSRLPKFERSCILPDSLYSHFPDRSSGLRLEIDISNAGELDMPYSAEEFATTFFFQVYKYLDNRDLDKFYKEIKSKSSISYKSSDTNYVAIASERDLFSRFDSLTLSNSFTEIQNNNVIPDFYGYFTESKNLISTKNLCGLSDDFHLYILKTGLKYVLPEKYRYNWSILPDNAKHGYSSGIAINEKEKFLLFWAIAW